MQTTFYLGIEFKRGKRGRESVLASEEIEFKRGKWGRESVLASEGKDLRWLARERICKGLLCANGLLAKRQKSPHVFFPFAIDGHLQISLVEFVELRTSLDTQLHQTIKCQALWVAMTTGNLVIHIYKNNFLHLLCDNCRLKSKKRTIGKCLKKTLHKIYHLILLWLVFFTPFGALGDWSM